MTPSAARPADKTPALSPEIRAALDAIRDDKDLSLHALEARMEATEAGAFARAVILASGLSDEKTDAIFDHLFSEDSSPPDKLDAGFRSRRRPRRGWWR